MSELVNKDRETRRLHRFIDIQAREARKHINSPAHSVWVTVSARFAASAALELYPELRGDQPAQDAERRPE